VDVVVVGVVVVVVVAQEVFCVSPDLRMSELRKSQSVCMSTFLKDKQKIKNSIDSDAIQPQGKKFIPQTM
jgi:hypothetical protein